MELLDKIKESGVSVSSLSMATGIPEPRIYKWMQGKANPREKDRMLLEKFVKGELITATEVPEKEIAAIKANNKLLMLELMQLRSQITGESISSIQQEYEKWIEQALKQSV